ncbi:unnamed protein product [Rangifer tarandus platyrhynchus]|uniref:Uncharacterized protein n=1 Tax=Rangifer tarandus platyrhynchus TaxID=3082113 RepID=A0AC59YNB7_RANTA
MLGLRPREGSADLARLCDRGRHRPANAQTSPASLRRARSPTLPQHLARLLPAGVFTAILLFVTRLPCLETPSDSVKDTVRATVG